MVMINHDYSDFNPEGAKVVPEGGHYILQFVKGDSKMKDQDKGGYSYVEVVFEVIDGHNIGQQFPMDYLTGYVKKPTDKYDTSKIAMESLGRVYFGATGDKPPVRGFDLNELNGKQFVCDIVVKETPAIDKNNGQQILREDGEPLMYRNANMRGIRPVEPTDVGAAETSEAAAPAQAAATAVWDKPAA